MNINMSSDTYFFIQTSVVDNVLVPPPGKGWLLVEWNGDQALWACQLNKLPAEFRNPRSQQPQYGQPNYPPMPARQPQQQAYVPPTAPIQPYSGPPAEEFSAEELGADPSTPAGRAMLKRLAEEQGG